MQGKLKKLKDNTGQYIYPVTHSDAVFVNNKSLTQTLEELPTSSASSSDVALKKPVVVFIYDDTSDVNYDNMNIFTSRGVRYTTGLRQDFITSSFTWDKVREMQSQGFEIAYHGMTHNFTVGTLAADIAEYLTITDREGIKINGYIGANGLWDENIVFHTYFERFKWARGSGASNGVANVKNPVDYFKHIYDSNSFIDDLTSDTAVTTLKTKIDALATRGTGVLTLSAHMTSAQVPYIAQILDYIISKNIQIMTVSEAYEIYGAVLEFYDSSLILGGDFTKRGSGNGGTSINPASPHFILQKDGTLITNGAAVKFTLPKYKGVALNGNTLPDSFEVGVSIVQYGSTDDRAGFPNVGTLYNFNLGKDNGQQFQLYKCHNIGGIYYREANTDNTWKSGMVNKLGVFRATVPTTPTSSGFKGDFTADANYLYICHSDNNWIRVAKDSAWV